MSADKQSAQRRQAVSGRPQMALLATARTVGGRREHAYEREAGTDSVVSYNRITDI